MIIYETAIIKVTCDLWGRWSVCYKGLNKQDELINARKALRIIQLEVEMWDRNTEEGREY